LHHAAGILVASVVMSLAHSAASDGEYQPLKISEESFRSRVSVIALMALGLPPDVRLPDSTLEEAEKILAAAVRSRGYRIVPATEFESTWRRYSEQVGGVYDPVTGLRNDEKYGVVWDFTTRELQDRFDADAFLDPDVYYGSMRAHSTPQALEVHWEVWKGKLEWAGMPLTVMPQFVNGAWIGFQIVDADHAKLYDVGRSLNYVAVYALQGREALPAARLFESLDRYRAEIEAALNRLPRKILSPSPPGS